jgi:hypothetical protein
VTDLQPADVTIRVAGKPRTIQSLTLKTVAAAPAPPAAADPAGAAPAAGSITPPFVTNEPTAAPAAGAAGRTFLIIIDVESLRAGTEADMKKALEGLLVGLTPADRVAFSLAPRDTAQVGFGSPLSRVREAVAALRGQRPASVSTADALCRTADTLKFVSGMLEPMAGMETPMALVFISGTLSTAGRSQGSSGTCEVLTDHYREVAAAAANARANVYVVQGDSATMGRDSGLENLAGETGAGQVLRVVNEGFAPRVLADASSYWVATLEPDPSDRPGQPQRLEVRAKEGLTVHSRNSLGMVRPAAAAGGPAKPASTNPRDMVASTRPYTDLQLRGLVHVQRGQADKQTMLVFAEPVDPSTKIAAMRVGFFDSSNRGNSLDAPQLASFPITTIVPVGVGQYRIRVAATDASGKAGALDIPVNTALAEAGPFKMSTILLVAPPENRPRLSFSSEPQIIAMFELYGQPTGQNIRIGFEVAESDTGPAMKGMTIPPSGYNPTNEPDKFQIVGEIPIANLKPGDYVVRGVVQQQGQPEGKVLRTFRKIAK